MLLGSWCEALLGLPTFRRPDSQKDITFPLSSLLSSFWMLTRVYVLFLGLLACLLFLQRSPLSAGWPLVHLVAHLQEALTHMASAPPLLCPLPGSCWGLQCVSLGGFISNPSKVVLKFPYESVPKSSY